MYCLTFYVLSVIYIRSIYVKGVWFVWSSLPGAPNRMSPGLSAPVPPSLSVAKSFHRLYGIGYGMTIMAEEIFAWLGQLAQLVISN